MGSYSRQCLQGMNIQYAHNVSWESSDLVVIESTLQTTYRMRLNFRGMNLSRFERFGRPSANSLICKYFEQVLQNRTKMDAEYRIRSNFHKMNISRIVICKGISCFKFCEWQPDYIIQKYIREDIFSRRPTTSQNLRK